MVMSKPLIFRGENSLNTSNVRELLVEAELGIRAGVAGGNFFILADNQPAGLLAADAAVDAIEAVAGAITPFRVE